MSKIHKQQITSCTLQVSRKASYYTRYWWINSCFPIILGISLWSFQSSIFLLKKKKRQHFLSKLSELEKREYIKSGKIKVLDVIQNKRWVLTMYRTTDNRKKRKHASSPTATSRVQVMGGRSQSLTPQGKAGILWLIICRNRYLNITLSRTPTWPAYQSEGMRHLHFTLD